MVRCNPPEIKVQSSVDGIEAAINQSPDKCWRVVGPAGQVICSACVGACEPAADIVRPIPEEIVWGVPGVESD